MKFKLSDEAYNFLKWIALIVIPAVGTFYYGFAGIWGLPYAEQIAGTLTLVEVLLGSLLGVSCYNYNKEKKTEELE